MRAYSITAPSSIEYQYYVHFYNCLQTLDFIEAVEGKESNVANQKI